MVRSCIAKSPSNSTLLHRDWSLKRETVSSTLQRNEFQAHCIKSPVTRLIIAIGVETKIEQWQLVKERRSEGAEPCEPWSILPRQPRLQATRPTKLVWLTLVGSVHVYALTISNTVQTITLNKRLLLI